jgi:hypothetical protein
MPTPTDKDLYDKIKIEITSKYKPSAYRSGMIVKKYKEEYLKKHNNSNAYTGNRENSNLKRWFSEAWRNQRGEVGYKNQNDVYRPTIRVNAKTPTTFNELSHNQIIRAMNEKMNTGKVRRFKST